MIAFLRSLFGCAHERTTFPQSKPSATPHVVCLDCGREFVYDWDQMRIGEPIEPPRPRRFNEGLETRI